MNLSVADLAKNTGWLKMIAAIFI